MELHFMFLSYQDSHSKSHESWRNQPKYFDRSHYQHWQTASSNKSFHPLRSVRLTNQRMDSLYQLLQYSDRKQIRLQKMSSKKRVVRNLHIEISDEGDIDEDNPDSKTLEERSTHKNTTSPPIEYDISLGLQLLKVFARGHKLRLKMQAFMKLRYLYEASTQGARPRVNSQSSSKSSGKLEPFSSRFNSRVNSNFFNSAVDEPVEHGLERAKLLNNIMEKLQETNNGKAEVERVSGLIERRSTERTMSTKLDNLERILKDIHKQAETKPQVTNGYARKRARAKGDRHPPDTSAFTVKPYSAVVHRTEPDAIVFQRKEEKSVPRLVTFQDAMSSLIEENSESSEAKYNQNQLFEQKQGRKRTNQSNPKTNQQFADQLKQLSKELTQLKRINQEYIIKNTAILQRQRTNQSSQPYLDYNEQQFLNRLEPQRNNYQFSTLSRRYEQSIPEEQIIYIRNGQIYNETRQNPERVYYNEMARLENNFHSESYRNLRKPAPQSRRQFIRNPQPFNRYVHPRQRYVSPQQVHPPPYYGNIHPLQQNYQSQSQPYININGNSRSNLQHTGPYRQVCRQMPQRHVRFNSSSTANLVDYGRGSRILKIPVQQSYRPRQHPSRHL